MASAVGLTRVWATGPQTPNIDPGLTKWALGWIAEIPTLQVLNYINNRNDTNQLALAERGVFQWVGGVNYKLGALSWDEADSIIYKAKVASPDTTLRPGANLAQWDPSSIQISRYQYDANAAAWAAHIANNANPHQLTAHQLSSYTAVEIDAKVGVVSAAIDAHVSIVAGNPHGTTAADVGAVPVAGGTYTGVVNHRYAQTLFGPPAQAGSMNATTAGITIGKGAVARLGLSATSTPIAIDAAGVVSTLLTEASYVAQRTVQAPLYALPAPDSWLVAKNGLQLVTGVGAITFTAPAGRYYYGKDWGIYASLTNIPALTPWGMMFSASQDLLSYPVANNLQGFDKWSIFMDFRTSTGNQSYFNIAQGDGAYMQLLQQAGVMYLEYYLGGVKNTSVILPTPTAPAGTDHKVVLTFDGTNIRAYFDGALTTTLAASTFNKFAANTTGIQLGFNGNGGSIMYIRDFRTWNTALTDKQASQL